MPARTPAPLQLPHSHLMGCPQTDPGHRRRFQHRTHPHWERAQPRCPSRPRIMPQVGPIPKGIQPSPGACFTHKGSFAFPMEFPLLSNLLFSEAPPSIHPFPTFAAQNLLFSLLFPVSIQSVASSIGKLGKKTYLGKHFFKLESPFGGCGSFIPRPTGMPPRGGRMQHPNFFPERRIPNSIPPGVEMAPCDGARSGSGSSWSCFGGIHGWGDAPHSVCPSHRIPGAAGHRNRGRLLLEEEVSVPNPRDEFSKAPVLSKEKPWNAVDAPLPSTGSPGRATR